MAKEDFETRHLELEKDIATAKTLLAELRQKMAKSKDDFERRRLEVNIEDVTSQLKDFEYALSEMTHGKE